MESTVTQSDNDTLLKQSRLLYEINRLYRVLEFQSNTDYNYELIKTQMPIKVSDASKPMIDYITKKFGYPTHISYDDIRKLLTEPQDEFNFTKCVDIGMEEYTIIEIGKFCLSTSGCSGCFAVILRSNEHLALMHTSIASEVLYEMIETFEKKLQQEQDCDSIDLIIFCGLYDPETETRDRGSLADFCNNVYLKTHTTIPRNIKINYINKAGLHPKILSDKARGLSKKDEDENINPNMSCGVVVDYNGRTYQFHFDL
jgi:hypothetical protein